MPTIIGEMKSLITYYDVTTLMETQLYLSLVISIKPLYFSTINFQLVQYMLARAAVDSHDIKRISWFPKKWLNQALSSPDSSVIACSLKSRDILLLAPFLQLGPMEWHCSLGIQPVLTLCRFYFQAGRRQSHPRRRCIRRAGSRGRCCHRWWRRHDEVSAEVRYRGSHHFLLVNMFPSYKSSHYVGRKSQVNDASQFKSKVSSLY